MRHEHRDGVLLLFERAQGEFRTDEARDDREEDRLGACQPYESQRFDVISGAPEFPRCLYCSAVLDARGTTPHKHESLSFGLFEFVIDSHELGVDDVGVETPLHGEAENTVVSPGYAYRAWF